MGLDIYLERFDNLEDIQGYEMKCRENDDWEPVFKSIRQKSTLYPDHYFDIGYFHSSYNGSGTNQVLEKFKVPTLYEIFDVKWDVCLPKINWEESLTRCESATQALKEAIKALPFNCLAVDNYMPDSWKFPKSEAEALELFGKEFKKFEAKTDKDKEWMSSYGTGHNEYFMKGLHVHAVINGFKYNSPTHFLVYKVDEADLEWYVQALEIVAETIRFVIAQEDREHYVLHWSG